MKTLLMVLGLLLLSFGSSGCMLIGAGIGAAVPRYSEAPARSEVAAVDEASADAPRLQPLEEVSHVKRRVGSYALRGFAIGAAIDGTLAIAATLFALVAASYGAGFGAMGVM